MKVIKGLKKFYQRFLKGFENTTEGIDQQPKLYGSVKEKVSDATNNARIPVLKPKKEIMIGRVKQIPVVLLILLNYLLR